MLKLLCGYVFRKKHYLFNVVKNDLSVEFTECISCIYQRTRHSSQQKHFHTKCKVVTMPNSSLAKVFLQLLLLFIVISCVESIWSLQWSKLTACFIFLWAFVCIRPFGLSPSVRRQFRVIIQLVHDGFWVVFTQQQDSKLKNSKSTCLINLKFS